jgi:phosphoglycolate phosphatase-like HAD superfamily hydrolase
LQKIRAVLFDPVGCLAEFQPDEFNAALARVFNQQDTRETGSDAYWHLLDVMDDIGHEMTPDQSAVLTELELQAVEKADCYEDVTPALAELNAMGITLLIASSLSAAAVNRFLEKFSLIDQFSGVWTRDNAGGIKAAPLLRAMESAAVDPQHVMALVDTSDSLTLAKELGVNAMLMINEYYQGRRLATQEPAGGIVSLHELPDAIKLVAEETRLRR